MRKKTSGRGSHSYILLMAQFSIMLALEAIVCFTPLGSLPIGPMVATISHIPVIITAINMGIISGTAMGFFFGLFSFIVWSFATPNPLLAFMFTPVYAPGNIWSLVICFIPRMLIGTVTGIVFKLLQKFAKKNKVMDVISYTAAALLGSLTNTILVCGIGYLAFIDDLNEALGTAFASAFAFIIAFAGVNGLLEILLAGVCAYVICKPIRTFILKDGKAKITD